MSHMCIGGRHIITRIFVAFLLRWGLLCPFVAIVGSSCIHAYIFANLFDVVVGHVLVRSRGRRRRRCYTGASAGRSEGVKEVALVCSPPWLVSVGRRDIVLCRQGSGS